MSPGSRRLLSSAATHRGSRALAGVAWLAALAFACSRSEGARQSPASPPRASATEEEVAPPDTPAPAPPPKDDVEAAQRWLDALRDGNTRELQAYTAYPFELHEEGGCKLQHAASRERLAGAVACLSTDAELLDLLRRHEPSALQVLPDSARSMVDDLDVRAPLEQLVTGFVHRSDARADFVFWIADGGVRGVWKAGPRGAGEIGIATEWLEALRTRDLERLARVTSYPFELRDAGDDATCGKRVAKTREQLGKVIGCLFRSEPLQRALADSTLQGGDFF